MTERSTRQKGAISKRGRDSNLHLVVADGQSACVCASSIVMITRRAARNQQITAQVMAPNLYLSAFIERHQTTGDVKMTTMSANCAFCPAVNERVLVIFIFIDDRLR